MVVTDLVVLPVGCLVCGLLFASSTLLRSLPVLRRVVLGLYPYRVPLGLATALAGLLSLFFPSSGPPLLGSFFPAAIGIVVGFALSLEVLLDMPFLKRHRRAFARIGNALMYLRGPLGLLSIFGGVLHFCFPGAPFF